MFEYDKVYDYLFNNDKFVDILYKFHSSNWKDLDVKGRYEIIKEFIECYCETLKIESLKAKKISTKFCGSYSDMNSLVDVSASAVKEDSQYDVMDTLFHELRHNFQHRAISGNLTELETVTEKQLNEWKLNFMSSPSGYSNYISTEGENGGLYLYQPVEEDAFKTGLCLTRKAYEIIEKKLGEDVEFAYYGAKNRNTIMTYFSDEKEWVDYSTECKEKVFEVFKTNNKKFEIEKKCLGIAKDIMEKDLNEIPDEELCSLFSVYVWPHLDDDYKIDLVKEYDRRVNPYKPIKIEKHSNSGFKIDGIEVYREGVMSILNDLFSYEFRKKVEGIIAGKEECDSKIREDLTVNMYKVKGKKINFIYDQDNLFTYSIQPYAVLEGKVIVEQFKEMQRCEEKIFGVKEGDYDSMIDFYDYGKYIPFIEKFYGKSFKTVYNDMLKGMKENIKKNSIKNK